MNTELAKWVDDQITASGLDDEVGLLILASLDGDAELGAYLSEGTSARRDPASSGASVEDAGGTFLTSVKVEGFRGIGPATTLRLDPRPGLTIVAGRNGSGKSSLAEALELVLTGETYRWRNKSTMWSEKWRNLHHAHAQVRVGLVEEARGPVAVATSWADGQADLTVRETRTQRTVDGQVQPQQDGLGDLGWSRPLEQFRPMLSYDELGALLAQGPSKLYDALASILGVEQISDALKRIQARLKDLKAPQSAANTQRKTLQAEAAQLGDERAGDAAVLLNKTTPDSATLRALATGTAAPPAGPIGALRALTSVAFPASANQVAQVADQVRSAVASVADSAATVSQRELARLEVLEAALQLHADHGEMNCPVCWRTDLDDDWRAMSAGLAADLRRQMSDLANSQQTLRIAVGELAKLRAFRPTALQDSPLPATDDAVAAARTAWDRFLALPAGDDTAAHLARADHIETQVRPLLDSLETLRATAAAELDRLNDVWQPLASRIAAWCDAWDE
ncbi:MAG: ATP-binding protein, partial [Nocardioides sp.]|nr:ATP-binding protein [Nocardioides sp.]